MDDALRLRVTGITHTGKIAYLRFPLPTGSDEDKGQLELEIYRILQREAMPLYLNSTDGDSFAFAIAREHLPQLNGVMDGLVVPIDMSARQASRGRVYLFGLGVRNPAFEAQKALLGRVQDTVEVRPIEAEVSENCTVVSVIAARFRGVPGVMALILETLDGAGVPVYQTADSELSISVLIPEADVPKATRALHDVFHLVLAE
jgi:aspartate kinase